MSLLLGYYAILVQFYIFNLSHPKNLNGFISLYTNTISYSLLLIEEKQKS